MTGFTIITGANGQIGSRLAHSFAEAGKPLLLLYLRDNRRIHGLSKADGVLALSCDLCDVEAVKSALSQARSGFNAEPAGLVHTAAVRSSDAALVAEGDPQVFAGVLTQNVCAAYNILNAVLPSMRANGFGRVVMFGSNVAATGLIRGSAYAAAKAAIVNLVKTAALENAGHGILINAISPAPVETRLEEDYEGDYLKFRQNYFARMRAASPTGKLVSIDEIIRLAELLLSPQIANLNGVNITLDGGFSAVDTGSLTEEK